MQALSVCSNKDRRLDIALGVNEGHACLVNEPSANRIYETHAFDGLNALSTKVDLGTCGSQHRETFGDNNLATDSCELGGQGEVCNTSAASEDFQNHFVEIIQKDVRRKTDSLSNRP